MPKPWEKYAAKAPAAAGPWAKYGPGGGSSAPDFSSVRGEFREAARPEPRKPERLVDAIPTAGPASRALLETGEDFARAGLHHAGSAFHGGAQAIEHGVGWLADKLLPEPAQNLSGLITGERPEPTSIGERARRYIEDTIAADDEALRRREAAYQAQVPDSAGATGGAVVGAVAPFLLSAGRLGGAQAGNIAGRLGATIGPRAEKLARAVGFGTAEGAVGAAAAPVLGGDFASEKLDQLSVGALAGGGLPIVGQGLSLAGNIARPILRIGDRFTQSGARREAAEQIRKVATDPGKVATTVAPSRVADSRRTLATESLDPGVAALEDLARQTDGSFAVIDRANNEARVAALRPFAGDDVSIADAERARDAVAGPLRRAAEKSGAIVDTSRLVGGVDRAIESLQGRPLVQHALRDLREQLFRPATAAEKKIPGWPDFVPIDDVRTLYNVRKTIGDWLSATSDKPYKEAAQRELLVARDLLDAEMADASPEFAQYLQAFRAGSRDVNRLQVGRELLEGGAGKSNVDPITHSPTLTPASFGAQTSTPRRLDKTAQTATGFRKARMGNIASPGMMTAIADVGDDLRRVGKVGQMLNSNSRTAARQKLDETLAEGAVGAILAKLPLVGGMVGTVNRKGGERVREQLVFLLQNPEEARAALRALPPADAAKLAEILARLSGAAGHAAGNAQETEVDVVGGTPAPRDEVARNIERYAR